MMFINASPYPWPYNGDFSAENTALLVIDMQADFVSKGGWVDKQGYDIALTARAVGPIQRLLAVARTVKGFTIIQTREGHRPDLSDLPENKLWRSQRIGAAIGSEGPLGRLLIRGEKGWNIIPELYPQPGEIVIDKPGKGAFYATDLEAILRKRHISNLIFTGVTTDCCVSTTLRDANDRGYECITLEDCTGATIFTNHESTLSTIQTTGGLFGCVSSSGPVIEALRQLAQQQKEAENDDD